jgi:hypothetical protein
MSCGTAQSANAMDPYLMERDTPSAAWSDFEDGSSQEISPFVRVVTSETTALASSMDLQAHHDPTRSTCLGQDGPPGQRGDCVISRSCISGTG